MPLPKNNKDEVVADNNGDKDGNSIKISNNDHKEETPIRDDKSPPKKMLKRRNLDLYATKDEEDEWFLFYNAFFPLRKIWPKSVESQKLSVIIQHSILYSGTSVFNNYSIFC